MEPTSASDTFGNYLKKISRYKILTDNEVKDLSTKIRAYLNLVDKLKEAPEITKFSEQCGYLKLSEEEFNTIKQTAKEAKQTLIMHNIRFVAHVAKRYQAYGTNIEDLVQEGTIGLNRAAELFRPERGYKFTTYAFWWIRQAITKSLNLTSKSIKLPPDIQVLLKKIKEVKAEITKEKGYAPSISEIAKALNKSENRIYQALNCTKEFLTAEIIEYQPSLSDVKEPQVANCSVSSVTPELIAQLTPMQQFIVIRKFGLDGEDPVSYKKIAEMLKCSTQVILKEKTEAFDKLKEICS